ncbi:hypothetical protein N0B31_01435 [Salinirubellus salinus]|uniref:Uncharacterized protein n=1 Tax=Salinirubellus salinus TaxID=1364945 RepID=A0A9E7R570_9EURY|nr:hypothetical protein [Salinirubellus salinus]UWM54953.1 hypothetical protein N0B31_01435 [Salinirubellus salinus]
MSRSSARGQVAPEVALAAVFVVTAGLALYAGVAADVLDALGAGREREAGQRLAAQTADRVADTARVDGAVRPARLAAGVADGPAGYRVNATLLTRAGRWTAGPAPPARAHLAERRVATYLGPGRVRPAVLRVRMWR